MSEEVKEEEKVVRDPIDVANHKIEELNSKLVAQEKQIEQLTVAKNQGRGDFQPVEAGQKTFGDVLGGVCPPQIRNKPIGPEAEKALLKS